MPDIHVLDGDDEALLRCIQAGLDEAYRGYQGNYPEDLYISGLRRVAAALGINFFPEERNGIRIVRREAITPRDPRV